MKITIKGLLSGRPDEAAEVLMEQAPMPDRDYPNQLNTNLEHYKILMGHVLLGKQFMVEVRDQKSLNALAGYFWVEPRRL